MNGRINGGPVRNYEGIGDGLRNIRERIGIPQERLPGPLALLSLASSRLEDFTQTLGISLRTACKTFASLGL